MLRKTRLTFYSKIVKMRGDCKWPAVSASVHFVLGGHLGFASSRGLGRAGLSHPASSPTLYRSSIQLQSKMATSKNLVYREFRSKITPALQAMDCVVIQRVKWNRHGFFSCLTFRRLSKPLRAAESTFTQVSNGTFNLKICGYVVKKKIFTRDKSPSLRPDRPETRLE